MTTFDLSRRELAEVCVRSQDSFVHALHNDIEGAQFGAADVLECELSKLPIDAQAITVSASKDDDVVGPSCR